jgi:hypothetical protein
MLRWNKKTAFYCPKLKRRLLDIAIWRESFDVVDVIAAAKDEVRSEESE